MLQSSPVAGGQSVSRRTRHILLIDDNAQLRAILSRQILLSCTNFNRSCAIYHLGERCEPRLTYFQHAEDNIQITETGVEPDFALYEAASPRHALMWLEQANLSRLTIISDVMMPVDTEVGLPGLINGLHDLKIAVNLVFVSSESQNKALVQSLLTDRQIFFLIKGSEAWTRLPDALIQGADRFHYQLLPKLSMNNPSPEKNVKISRSPYSNDVTSRRFTTAPALISNTPAPTTMRPITAGGISSSQSTLSTRRELAVEASQTQTKPSGFFSRILTWFRG